MKKLIFLVIFACLLAACSSSDQSNEEKELANKVYSDETNKAFEMIERGHANRYAKINQPNLSVIKPPQVRYQSSEPQTPILPIAPIDETIFHRPADKIIAPMAEPKVQQSEKLIELNQNLAFYCMKHRKSNRFKNDEKKCMDYVTGMLNHCQSSNSVHSKLLSCMKKKLTLK